MNEALTLASFSTNSASTKEKIIHLLAEKWPLSAKEIFEKLTREYSSDISYQAAHKFLLELEKENTIEKTENKWKLKKEWIQKGQQFFNKAIEKQNGKLNRYDIPENFDGTLTFEFDSFTELCVKTAELLKSKKLGKNNDSCFLCVLEYGWWAFNFKFEHLQLLWDMMVNCPKSSNIIRKDTQFGRWIREQYIKVSNKFDGIAAPIGTKVEINEDIFIQGDYIIQVKISEEGKQIIEHYWNKWNGIEDTLRDFGLKKEPTIYSTVKITKNTQLAELLRNELEKYFSDKNV